MVEGSGLSSREESKDARLAGRDYARRRRGRGKEDKRRTSSVQRDDNEHSLSSLRQISVGLSHGDEGLYKARAKRDQHENVLTLSRRSRREET